MGQVGQIGGYEETAECRQTETRFTRGESVEQRPQAVPTVVMPIERCVPGAALAKAAYGVAVPIGLSGGVCCIRDVQEAAILGGETGRSTGRRDAEAPRNRLAGLACRSGGRHADRCLPDSRESPCQAQEGPPRRQAGAFPSQRSRRCVHAHASARASNRMGPCQRCQACCCESTAKARRNRRRALR